MSSGGQRHSGYCVHDNIKRTCELCAKDAEIAAYREENRGLRERVGMATSYEIPAADGGHYRIGVCFCHECYRGNPQWTIQHHTSPAYLIRDAPSISVVTQYIESGRFGAPGSHDPMKHFPTADDAFAALARWQNGREKS